MARYEVRFKRSVAKDLRSLPKQDVKRILSRIDEIAENPRGTGTNKLTGKELYRARQGAYRIIYEIADDVLIVQIIRIAHRSTVYRLH